MAANGAIQAVARGLPTGAFSAASGASGKAHVDDFTDGVPKHIAETVNKWSKWRAGNPVRGNGGAGA